jgi:hypothetical protein
VFRVAASTLLAGVGLQSVRSMQAVIDSQP